MTAKKKTTTNNASQTRTLEKDYKGAKFERSFYLKRENVNVDERTVELAFSSEAEIERWFGVEILDHNPESVRLDRLRNGGAVLVNHNIGQQVGVTLSANIDKDKRARAVVKFSRSQFADEIFNDVNDGIRSLVSVGYMIHGYKEEKKDGINYIRATDWEPYEISFVSIPADVSVGVGRSDDLINLDPEGKRMENETEETVVTKTETRAAPPVAFNPDAELAKMRKQESQRVESIRAMAGEQNLDELGRQAIDEGWTYEDFNERALKEIGKRNAKAREESEESGDVGLSRRERQRFSFTRLMLALGHPQDRAAQRAAGFELEVSDAAAKKFGDDFTVRGAFIPQEVLFGGVSDIELDSIYRGMRLQQLNLKRDLSAGTATDGAELVATNLLAGSFIDVLRNSMVTAKAGVRMLPGLTGIVDIPRKTSGSAAGWISAEDGDASNSDAQFDQVSLSPKDLACYTQVTRRLLLQSTPAIDGLVRDDLAVAIALGLDLATLYGSGAAGQPTGVRNQTGINTFNFAAAAPTYAEAVRMVKEVMADNALLGSLGYIIDPAGWEDAMTTAKAANTAVFLMDDNGKINGYNAHVTKQVTAEDWFFGNWADCLVGEWGGLELNVDPYTHSLKGKIRYVIFKTADVAVRHPESFIHCNDGV